MSLLDKNKLFFGLIHYVLSEQKNVDWILKTSIADFLGVNLKLEETDYSTNDLTKKMIDFLYDIKPYHVQFNKYIEKFLVNEDINLNIQEICNNTLKLRYDAIKTDVDDIVDLYINDFSFSAWELSQETVEWGSQTTYNKGTFVKYDDKVYKIEKKYTPTSDEFIFNNEYMSIIPIILYTKESKPTSNDKIYGKEINSVSIEIVEMIGYSLKEDTVDLNHRKIYINDIEYTANTSKNLFQNNDVVSLYNTHKANRLCVSGLISNNIYGELHTDNTEFEETLYVLDNDIRVDKPIYKFVEYDEQYDEDNVTLIKKVLKYRMVQVGTIKSFSYLTDSTQFIDIVVDIFDDNKHTDVEYTNYHIEDEEYKLNNNFIINEPDYDRIIDAMNAHFKGLTVDGGQFNIDIYGYDEFPYDKEKYDAPSVEVDYCMIKSTENVGDYTNIKRNFVEVGKKDFSIGNINKNDMVITIKRNKQLPRELTSGEYLKQDYTISILDELDAYDELYISDSSHILIYYAHPFVETENDTIKRVRVELENPMVLEPMDSDFALVDSKIFVHKETEKGKKQLLSSNNDFIIKDGKVIVYNLQENEHIIISSYDYRYLYDKVYSYEDNIGRSNNVITLDGEGMLRPLHEADRTDEKITSYPIDGLMYLEKSENQKTADIKRVDSNKNIKYMTVEIPSTMRIENFITREDGLTTEIVLNDATLLMNTIPGKIYVLHKKDDDYVPGELIEYQNVIDNKILTGIKRAREGTPLYIGRDGGKKYNELLSINDYVYNADDTRWFELKTDEESLLKPETENLVVWTVNNKTREIIDDTYELCSFDKVGYKSDGNTIVEHKSIKLRRDKTLPTMESMIVNSFEYNYISQSNIINGDEKLVSNSNGWVIKGHDSSYIKSYNNSNNEPITINYTLYQECAVYEDDDINVMFEYNNYIINTRTFNINEATSDKDGYNKSIFNDNNIIKYMDQSISLNTQIDLYKEIIIETPVEPEEPTNPIIPEEQPTDEIVSKSFENESIVLDTTNKQIKLSIDYVIKHSLMPEERTTITKSLEYSLKGLSNWEATTNDINYTSDSVLKVNTSQIIIDDIWKYTKYTYSYSNIVSLSSGNKINQWRLIIPNDIVITKDGVKHTFNNINISEANTTDSVNYSNETSSDKFYNYNSILTVSIQNIQHTANVSGLIVIAKPNISSWGKFTSGTCTIAKNEAGNGWVYTWSIHFENGTLPIVIRPNATNFDIDTSLFSNSTNNNINGGVYYNGKWQNAVATDQPKFMRWINETETAGLDALIYSSATMMNWYNGNNTVYCNEFTFNMNNDNTIMTIKKNGNLFARLKTDYTNNVVKEVF